MGRVMGPLEDVKEEENEEESPKEESRVAQEMLENPTNETKEEDVSDESWENVFETKRASTAPSIPVPPAAPAAPAQTEEEQIREEPNEPEVTEPVVDVPPEPTKTVEEITSPPEDLLEKTKEKEIVRPETPMAPVSPATSIVYPQPTPRSKYIDRNITSFVTSEAVIRSRRESSPPRVPKLTLQTQLAPSPASLTSSISLDRLPHFMSASDIPDMSTTAQRIGAYQSRREQMLKTDTGLRGWLLQVQQTRPSSVTLPQSIH
jgi:hypothetical protein